MSDDPVPSSILAVLPEIPVAGESESHAQEIDRLRRHLATVVVDDDNRSVADTAAAQRQQVTAQRRKGDALQIQIESRPSLVDGGTRQQTASDMRRQSDTCNFC